MPILDAAAPLPTRPRLVLVAGTSGAGKTAVAVRVAALLDVAHVEIDGYRALACWPAPDCCLTPARPRRGPARATTTPFSLSLAESVLVARS